MGDAVTSPARPLTLVTIVFQGDLDLLRYQARSVARFAAPADVAEVLVVLNDVNERALRAQVESIRSDYGRLAERLRVLGADELLLTAPRSRRKTLFEFLYVEHRNWLPFTAANGWRGGNGYRMQQALKLASARAATSDRMLILDAKNILLRPLHPDEFFDDRDRALAVYETPRPSYHRDWLAQSLAALEVPVEIEDIAETTGYSTPYPVNRKLVLRVLDEVGKRFGSVQALFASKRRPSEFMLLYASCLKHEGDVSRWYGRYGGKHLAIWPTFAPERIDDILSRAEADPPLTLGLHRKAMPVLNEEQRVRVFAIFDASGQDLRPLFGVKTSD